MRIKLFDVLLTGLIPFVLTIFITNSFSQWEEPRPGDIKFMPKHPGKGLLREMLSGEQQAILDSTVTLLEKDGKSRSQIKMVVDSLFTDWGIERPEPPHGPFGGGLMAQLSVEQHAELEDTIKQLRDAGKTREQVRTAVDALLDDWGIERPEPPHGPFNGGLMEQLSAEQRIELENTIDTLQKAGKTPQETHTAVDELLAKWGIEKPEPPFRPLTREIMEQLTAEQKRQILTRIHDMQKGGATPEEIRQAVNALLLKFGITPPEMNYESDKKSWESSSNDTGSDNTIIAGSGNFPNPFNPHTRISYTLAKPEKVKIQVFNINGQLVRTLIDSYQSGGNYACIWNGVLENGEPAPSGLYFYRIDAGGEQLVRRMTLTK